MVFNASYKILTATECGRESPSDTMTASRPMSDDSRSRSRLRGFIVSARALAFDLTLSSAWMLSGMPRPQIMAAVKLTKTRPLLRGNKGRNTAQGLLLATNLLNSYLAYRKLMPNIYSASSSSPPPPEAIIFLFTRPGRPPP